VIPDDTREPVFHPALRGWSGGPGIEPLAADFRPEAGGRRLALLKLVAALAGVRLDELIQRDAQRQVRRITVATSSAVAGLAVVATLAIFGLNAQHEAETQRARVGGLNTFMLTDLRKGLQSAGRLDLLTAVNKAALDSYKGQDLSRLPAESLEQRAKALQAAGEDNEKKGDLKTAQAQFEEARRTTAALLAAKPNEPQRIFDQAQSEYWVGFINWRNGNGGAAKAGFENYAKSAQRLFRMDPHNVAWRHEVAYAEKNLGMLAMRQQRDALAAERHFTTSLDTLRSISAGSPDDNSLQREVADAYAWLADSQRLKGDFAGALENRTMERGILEKLVSLDPRNAETRSDMLGNDLGLARIEADRGAPSKAIGRLNHALQLAHTLQRADPDNAGVSRKARMLELFKVRTFLHMKAAQRPPLKELAAVLGDCRSTSLSPSNDEIRDFCIALQGQVMALGGDTAGAESTFTPVRQARAGQALSTRWGLNFDEETKPYLAK
jgi:tetratricopeptide (TPR) repeat protein